MPGTEQRFNKCMFLSLMHIMISIPSHFIRNLKFATCKLNSLYDDNQLELGTRNPLLTRLLLSRSPEFPSTCLTHFSYLTSPDMNLHLKTLAQKVRSKIAFFFSLFINENHHSTLLEYIAQIPEIPNHNLLLATSDLVSYLFSIFHSVLVTLASCCSLNIKS